MLKMPRLPLEMSTSPTPEPRLFDGSHPEARDPAALESFLEKLDTLSRSYFRTEISGFDHVPDRRALVVGTHTGGFLAMDMFMFFHGWLRRFGDSRPLFGLAHDIHFANPLTRELFARGGAVRACREMAKKVLSLDDAFLAVYPTGARELFRPYQDRHRVDFGGHKGFVKLALEAQVPILPMVTLGADTFMVLNDGEKLAKLLGIDKALRMPVFPMMLSFPWGVTPGPVPHFPLPSQIRISIGQPIELPWGPEAAQDARKVDEIYRHVEGTMQDMRDRLRNVRQVGTRVSERGVKVLRTLVDRALRMGEPRPEPMLPVPTLHEQRGSGSSGVWRADGISTHLAGRRSEVVWADGVSTHLRSADAAPLQAEGVSTHLAAS